LKTRDFNAKKIGNSELMTMMHFLFGELFISRVLMKKSQMNLRINSSKPFLKSEGNNN